jgi:hypothetical protein
MSLPRGRLVALALGSLSLLMAGCGSDVDVEQEIPEQEVPGNFLAATLALVGFTIPIEVSVESQEEAHDTGRAHTAALKSMQLTITAPSGETFEFLDRIRIEVSAVGMPGALVAHLDDVPARSQIALTVVSQVDLLPYINRGAKLTAMVSGHAPRQTLRYKGRVVITLRG